MTYTEIMKLLDAGFNRDEILAMQNEDQHEDQHEENTDNTGDTEQETDVQGTVNDAITTALEEVKNTFDEFKKEFTAMNIMNSRIDNPDKGADDILANIINPFETIDK